MESFAGKFAVVTGGGGGIAREVVAQLAAEGCSVATIDLAEQQLAESIAAANAGAAAGARVTGHVCDITDAAGVDRVRDEILAEHGVEHVDLLLNVAAIFGAGSFLTDDRAAWERVFNVCWTGTYVVCRAFVPLVVAGPAGHIVNTASANALRATHGPGAPSTSYSAGKWAVRGFTEALIEDCRTHAPHVKVSLVIPGGVGTDIRANSGRMLDAESPGASVTSGSEHLRIYLGGMGVPIDDVSDAMLERLMDVMQSDVFAMPPAQGAKQLLDGVRADRWRVFIGVGVVQLDRAVRADPESIYELDGASLIDRDLLVSLMSIVSRYGGSPDGGADGLYELHLDETPIFCRVSGDDLQLSRAAGDRADVVVDASPADLRTVIAHDVPLGDAILNGSVRVSGDRDRLGRLIAAVAPVTA